VGPCLGQRAVVDVLNEIWQQEGIAGERKLAGDSPCALQTRQLILGAYQKALPHRALYHVCACGRVTRAHITCKRERSERRGANRTAAFHGIHVLPRGR
jgi:hypothetical protein